MIHNPFYSTEVQGPFEIIDIGDLVLEEGQTLRKCQLAVATFGTLSQAKDNAILIPTWYTGTHPIFAQTYRPRPRAGSNHVLHHRGQPDWRWPVHVAT